MSSFDSALSVVLAHEGGWVNHPTDPGGETNYGISMRFLREHGIQPQDIGLKDYAPGCLRGLTRDAAADLYWRFFWDSLELGEVTDQLSATKLFDAAVNMGCVQAVKLAQRAVGVTVDGVLGPVTRHAIGSMPGRVFVGAMSAEMLRFYEVLAAQKPSLAVFLPGWRARASWGT